MNNFVQFKGYIKQLLQIVFNSKYAVKCGVPLMQNPPQRPKQILTHKYKTKEISPANLKKGDQLLMNDGRVITIKSTHAGIFENSIAIFSTDANEKQICYLISNSVKVII